MDDLSVIIATLYRPPTLKVLEDACDEAGVPCYIIEGMRTNTAWNKGLSDSSTRYAIIVNDDVELRVDRWLERFAEHFASGDTWVGGVPQAAMQHLEHTPIHERIFSDWSQHFRGEPLHKGHLFGIDRKVFDRPVPDALTLYFGDDWFYWQHAALGNPCTALDIQFETGRWVPSLNTTDDSGWTAKHPGIEDFLGEPIEAIYERERIAWEGGLN